MIVTASQMKAAEEMAFAGGETPSGLMEIAGVGIARCISQFFPTPGSVVVCYGKGHNGGDALVAARYFRETGWRVLLRGAFPSQELAPLTRRHLEELQDVEVIQEMPDVNGTLLLLDGLLGIGATGASKGVLADRIIEMNRLRREKGAFTVAVDIPSGLDAATGEVFNPCVQADLTVTLGAVKTGLVADAATAVVGRIALIDLPGINASAGDPAEVATARGLRNLLPIRDFDTHKGTYGRIGIVAGSPGFLGAARLCSAAAVHAGGGLVTLYALPEYHDQLAVTCIPEVMVKRVESFGGILGEKNDVLAIGPGLGRDHDSEFRELVSKAMMPCMVDADALNAISGEVSILSKGAGPRLVTPHPGEMERLFPQAGRSRRLWAEDFVTRYPVTLLLKGARTIVAEKGIPVSFNTTGNPGMGSGGMGDVLTGVCAALIGAGYSPRDAAILGAWLCGRAAEISIFNGSDSQESLSATSVIGHLGSAFKSLRDGDC